MSPPCKPHAINSQGSHCHWLLVSPLLFWDLKAAFFYSYYFEVLPFSFIVISKSRQAISDPDAYGRERTWSQTMGCSLEACLQGWVACTVPSGLSGRLPLILFVSACTIKSVGFYLAKSLKKVASSSPKWQGFSKIQGLYCVPISAHSSCEQSHSVFVLSACVGLLKLF